MPMVRNELDDILVEFDVKYFGYSIQFFFNNNCLVYGINILSQKLTFLAYSIIFY